MARRRAHGEGSVHRRQSDGLWCAVLEVGYTNQGKRARKYFYGRSQREAIEKRTAYARDLEDGLASARAIKQRGYIIAEWLDYWLEKVAADCEPTTLDSYEGLVRVHIKPGLGGIRLRDLEVEDVERWLKDMTRNRVGLRTRQSALTRLRTALNFALQRRQQTGLRYNPATLVSMPAGKKTKIAPPNIDQARALFAAARGHRLEAVITVGLALGLRRGEILGLRWEDIDLDKRTLTVRRRVSRVKGQLLVREGVKMDPDRHDTVAVPDMLVTALKQHRQRQLEERLHTGPRWRGPEPTIDGKPAGYVFTSEIGTVLEPRNLYRAFDGIRQVAGQGDKTFHQLRHDCASLLLAQGVPMYAVSQILRHRNPSITARFYAHLTPELQRDAADRMDKLLQPLLR